MSQRKIVHSPALKGYYRWENKHHKLRHDLSYNTQFYNPFSFFTFLIGASFLLGFSYRHFWAISLVVSLLLIYLYFQTRRLAEGLSLKRMVQKSAREKDLLSISYVVGNASGFTLHDLVIEETFNGVSNGHFQVYCPPLRPESQMKVRKTVKLNTGMGIKEFEPFSIRLSDPLNVFDFRVQFYQASSLEVYPVIEEVPAFRNSLSPESTHFGFYEVPRRGDSNLFIGTREYRQGDPVKHINWRLSQKNRKLVVNEFEKNTNTFITMVIDLELRHQVGLGEVSTWEVAKDIALSITASEINRFNMIQILAGDMYVPWGTGHSQLEILERHFTHHEITRDRKSKDPRGILADLPHQGQLYYICPKLLSPQHLDDITWLAQLRLEGQNVIVLVVDPFRALAKEVARDKRPQIHALGKESDRDLITFKRKLGEFGIPVIEIEAGKETRLRPQLLKRGARHLEEYR